MFENVKDYAIFMLSPEGIVRGWNEGARRIKGYEASEIIGKHFSVFYPEEDVKMGKCDFEIREATVTGRFEDEGWRKRKDGTLFWANVVLTAVRDRNGKLLGFSKVTRDATERRQAEEKLKLALDHMERRVAERTLELSESNRKLKEAVQVRDEFLSIASHELRTPLTPLRLQIQGLVYQMKNKNLFKLSEERITRMAETCEKSVTKLSTLIESLLDVSRLNAGKFQLHIEEVDLVQLTNEVIERYQSDIAASGSQIELTAPESLVGAWDRMRMEQVITNLLTNAVKYGNGKPIHVELENNKGKAVIRVLDQGVGISTVDQGRVFERFERANNDTSVSGLGLGLYITRQILQAHNGSIRVESVEGQGSAFTVEIPLTLRVLS